MCTTAMGAAVLAVRRRYAVVTVQGESMQPTYREGDRVVIRRPVTARVGDVVVVEQPDPSPFDPRRRWSQPVTGRPGGRSWMIKRVGAIPGDPVPGDIPVPDEVVPPGQLILLGDNASTSYDSRIAGYFPAERVLGGVLRRLG
ncbi:S26 family signal peptidase [Pseudonocardia sp. TRM90224]|uniref:S26 family signal peptidase n=1 Tax=Pseudonocardia sp. TRM90224 TaxID=2812678 RepID=UPI0021071370|nr:S26 family signal peptidase [Pseudonocardia sp. TRM90224]